MLEITVPATEYFDESTGEFVRTNAVVLQLEHSLVSISKWECKWHKPFLGKEPKTNEEALDYIRCMTKTQNVSPLVYSAILADQFKMIDDYLENPMTATWINERQKQAPSRKIITNEVIYYWMFSLGIPMECEKWHLNRLLMLIRVCNIENAPAKKMSKKELMSQNQALNAARKQRLNTRG